VGHTYSRPDFCNGLPAKLFHDLRPVETNLRSSSEVPRSTVKLLKRQSVRALGGTVWPAV